MTALAWLLLLAWLATLTLLAIASYANADLVDEVHQLRRRIHPATRNRGELR